MARHSLTKESAFEEKIGRFPFLDHTTSMPRLARTILAPRLHQITQRGHCRYSLSGIHLGFVQMDLRYQLAGMATDVFSV
jgi:hypothetical protein